jgi:hypothetical protein
VKIFCLNKQKYLFVKQEKKIILAGLNSINELDKLEVYKQKKHEEKTKQEP